MEHKSLWPAKPGRKKGSGSFGPESNLQKLFVEWLRYQHPALSKVTFSVPNGGLRSKKEGRRQVEIGLTKGVPDLFCAYPCKGSPGLWIEIKWGKNTLSAEQRDMILRLLASGYCCAVVWTFEALQETIVDYLAGRAEDVRRRTIQILNRKAGANSIEPLEPGSGRAYYGDSSSRVEGWDIPKATEWPSPGLFPDGAIHA